MRWLSIGLGALVAVLSAGCATGPNEAPRTADAPGGIAGFYPRPAIVPGWNLAGEVCLYDEETVFDHINGEAELYYPYGFTKLAYAEYVAEADPDAYVTIDVYAMGSLLDAFGIYSNYFDADAERIDVGADGFCDGYQLMFYQGKHFVRMSGLADEAANRALLPPMAQALAARMPGGPARPEELGLIAIEQAVPDTAVYIAESVLGYAFFERGFITDLTVEGRNPRALVLLHEDADAAADALAQYAAHLETEGVAATETPSGVLMAQDPLYKGMAALRRGPHLLVVIGLTDPAHAMPVLDALAAQLPAS